MPEQVIIEFTALANMSSLISGVSAANAQISALSKNMASMGTVNTASMAQMNSNFARSMVSTGQFTQEMVSMRQATEKFGRALQEGKLGIRDYRRTATEAKQSTHSLTILQIEQGRK